MLNANSALCQLYHGENKLICNGFWYRRDELIHIINTNRMYHSKIGDSIMNCFTMIWTFRNNTRAITRLYAKATGKVRQCGKFTTRSCLFTGTLPVKVEPDVPTAKPENKTIGNFKDLSYHTKANLFCVLFDNNV